jgi:hypothetical protein
MVSELTLEFPEFITHVPLSRNKWQKIGYNKIHASAHFTVRNAFVAAMHKYIEKHMPKDYPVALPVETELIIYAPINYGDVKRLKDKKTGQGRISWKPAEADYVPRWDIGNLALVWIKCLDDVLQKKGILPEDTVQFLVKTSYEFREVATLQERKLVYKLKTFKKNGIQKP